MLPRSSSLSLTHAKCTGVLAEDVILIARQFAISFSCSELNWSAHLRTSVSQYHCATLASINEVGVSALYSRSLGARLPS